MEFRQIARNPVYRQVADQIRAAILEGNLGPGDPLPTERELCEQLGVSRASVREALRSLQAQGLVSGGGNSPARTVVTEGLAGPLKEALIHLVRLQRVPLADLVELRCVLEAAAVRSAADRHQVEHFEEAHQALQQMLVPGTSVEDFDSADVRFHIALVRSSGNEAMHQVMMAVREVVARYLLEALTSSPNLPAVLSRLAAEHKAILGAIEAGEGARASELVQHHITGFYQQVISRGGDGAQRRQPRRARSSA
jgi:DNA-binding FadR family transcriptional regulator